MLFALFPHLFAMKGWDWMPWAGFSGCWILSQLFHSPFFTFIKSLFSSSSLSAIRVVSSAYLKLLIFPLAILIPACASSSLAFCIIDISPYFSAYKVNKQGDNIQPWYTLFLIWNQSVVPCLVLTVASWPAYWCCFYSCIQKAGKVVWYSHLFKSFPVCCDPHSHRLWRSQ